MEFSFSQYCALDHERNWVVTAGAGAGKTSVLTHRYIHLLEQNLDLKVSEILALTFTQKAAEEMKGRIYKEILSRLSEEEDADSSSKERFYKLKEDFSENHISTFHSFCNRLLVSHPVESDIDPDVQLLSGSQRQQFLSEAYQEVLQGYIRRESENQLSDRNQLFLKLLECWEERQIRLRTMELLSIPRHYISFTQTFQKYAQNSQPFIRDVMLDAAKICYKNIFADQFLEKIQVTLSLADAETPFFALLQDISDQLKNIHKPMDLFSISKKANDWIEHEAVLQKARIRKAPLTAIKIRNHLLKSYILDLNDHLDQIGMDYLSCLIPFVNDVYAQYHQKLRRDHFLDFDLLQMKTLDLLKNNIQVQKECWKKFKYVLVDEFQDTDPVQWQIIKILNGHGEGLQAQKVFIVGDEKQAIYGFRGGDVEVFRKASNELILANDKEKPLFFEKTGLNTVSDQKYLAAFQSFAPDRRQKIRSGCIDFSENYRSNKNLIEFFNQFFALLLNPKNGFDPPHQVLHCMKDAEENPGSIQFLILPAKSTAKTTGENLGEGSRKIALRLWEAKMIAEYVQRVMKDDSKKWQSIHSAVQSNQAGIGLLFRRFTEIKVYEEIFRQQGIDFFVHRGKGFFRRQEILDLYNVLEFLNDTRKDIHLIGLLRSPGFGFTDQKIFELCRDKESATLFHHFKRSNDSEIKEIYHVLNRWYQLKDRLRISELLRWIIADTNWNAVWNMGIRGRQTLHNVEKFIDMARDFERAGIRGLSEYCQFLRSQIDRDEQEGEASLDLAASSGVVFMTIHQAKGLQFPMVILPDLNAQFNIPRTDLLDVLQVDETGEPQYFYGISCPDPQNAFARGSTLCRRVLLDRAKKRLIAEEKRLLYVAMTRAMETLVFAGRFQETKDGEKRDIDEATNVWQWLDQILDIQEGVQSLQVKGQGPEIPVSWYQPKGPIQQDIPLVQVPPVDTFLEQKKEEKYKIYLDPIQENSQLDISPTSLILFHQCPRKFFYQKILGIPEFLTFRTLERMGGVDEDQETGVDVSHSESDQVHASISGTVAHKILENPSQIPQGNFEQIVRGRVLQSVQSLDPSLREEISVEKIINIVVRQMNLFTKDSKYFPLFSALQERRPLRIFSEVPFEVECSGVILRGNIDKLFQEEEGGPWTIMDFKTNRLSPRIKENSHKLKEIVQQKYYDIQLNCYALACEQILGPGKVKKLFVYFTDHGMGAVEIPLQTDQILDQVEKLKEIFPHRNISLSKDIKPKEDRLCASCGYQTFQVCSYPQESKKEIK